MEKKFHVIARMQDADTGVYFNPGETFESDDEAQIERLIKAGCLSDKAPKGNASAGGGSAKNDTDNGGNGDNVDATESAVTFAKENKIDLADAVAKGLKGTGANGRIGKPDVESWHKAQTAA
mgnify:CR=1 FL=1